MKSVQRARNAPTRLMTGLSGLVLSLGLASIGPAQAAPGGPAESLAHSEGFLVSRDALVAAGGAEFDAPVVLIGQGDSAGFEEESSAPLQFGISHGASLGAMGLAHSGNQGLGLAQRSGASSSLSAWLSATSGGWWPTLSYTLDQQGPAEFVAGEARASGLADAVSSLSMHYVDLGWSGELWHAGYSLTSTTQRQLGQGVSRTAWQSSRDSLYLGFSPAGAFDLTFDLGVERVRDSFSGEVTRWDTRGVSANWVLGPRLGVHAGLSEGRAEAAEFVPGMKNRTADVTFTYHLDPAVGDAGATRQLFLRLDHQSFKSEATEFDAAGSSASWGIHVGLVLSTF